MSFGFARARRDAYLLLRLEADESGLRSAAQAAPIEIELEIDLPPAHQHGDDCACHLRGE